MPPDGGVLQPATPAGSPACGARRRPGRRSGHGRRAAASAASPGRSGWSSGPPVAGSVTMAVPCDADRPPALERGPAARGRAATIRAPAACASARWTRIPDCLAPRVHPNGQLPQVPQSAALRRIGAASQPRAAAPRRIASSLGGMTVASATPELSLHRGDIGVPLGAGHACRAVVARPLGADRLRRRDAGHPVDERAAADAAARQHRDRAVPGREQAVVEVQAGRRRRVRSWASSARRRTVPPRGRRPPCRPAPAPPPRRRRRRPNRRRRRPPRGPSARPAPDRERQARRTDAGRIEGDRRVGPSRSRSPPGAGSAPSTPGSA